MNKTTKLQILISVVAIGAMAVYTTVKLGPHRYRRYVPMMM